MSGALVGAWQGLAGGARPQVPGGSTIGSAASAAPSTLRLPAALALAALLAANPTQAHSGAVAYAAPLTKIAVDGDLSDWPAGWPHHDLVAVAGDSAAAQVRGRFRVGRDRVAALWVAVEIDDEVVVLDGEPPASWQDLQRFFGRGWRRREGPPPAPPPDGCALLIDIAHGDEEGRAFRFGLDGRQRSLFSVSGREGLPWSGVEVAMATTPGRRTCEWRVELGLAGAGPAPATGSVLGLEVTATDRDREGPTAFLGWSAGERRWRGWGLRPAGDLVLIDDGGEGTLRGMAAWDAAPAGQPMTPPPAAVRVRSAQGALLVVATEEDGFFRAKLPAGDYRVSLEDGRLGSDRREVAATVTGGRTTRGVAVADEPLFVLREPGGPPARRPLPEGRQRGVSWVGGRMVGRADVEDLAPVHADWIAQTPFGWQQELDKPALSDPRPEAGLWGESDRGLVVTARLARERGIATLLKPHIWTGGGAWCGDIAMQTEEDWAAWFAQYERFILYYARLAEAAGMEGLCIGTELVGTQAREREWRQVIARVRQVYGGWLVYAANWDAFEQVPFWDAVDFIGIQAYFPLAPSPTAQVDSLAAGWQPWLARLEGLARKTTKKVLFTEIGYRTGANAAVEPWLWERQVEERGGDDAGRRTQAACYEAFFRAVWDRPWVAGAYFWKWFPHHERAGGDGDESFSPQNKPAQSVLAQWYRRTLGRESGQDGGLPVEAARPAVADPAAAGGR